MRQSVRGPVPEGHKRGRRSSLAETQARVGMLEAELTAARERETATAEVLQVINSSNGDLQPVFDAMLEKAMTLCDAAFGGLFTYDSKRFVPVAGEGIPEPFQKLIGQSIRPEAGDPFDNIVEGAALSHRPDLAEVAAQYPNDPLLRAAVEVAGIRSLLIVPLRKDNVLLGAITVYRQEVRPFTDQQIALLQNFAAQAVIAMENARLLTETREALEKQTATAEILRVISRSPTDLQPTFDAIAANASALSGAAAGMVFRYDGSLIHFVANYGLPERTLEATRQGFPCPPGHQSATTRAIQTRDVVHVADVGADPEYTLQPIVESGWHTALAVPILQDGDPVGAITVARREVEPFSQPQIDLLKTFADQAAIAIENVRLFNETREALEQQTATAEVLQVINSSPGNLGPVFEAMVERSMRLCDAACGHLWRFDGEMLSSASVYGDPRIVDHMRKIGPTLPAPGSAVDRLQRGEGFVHVLDPTQERAYRDSETYRAFIDAGDIRTSLAVPLRRDGALLGAIVVYRQEVRPFADQQIALLENFAAQAVIAIENARLINETREALEQQTATAEVLQVINSSPGDLALVFESMLEKALRLCDAACGTLWICDGETFRLAAKHGVPPEFDEFLRGRGPLRPQAGSALQRMVDGERLFQVHDLATSEAPSSLGMRGAMAKAGARSAIWVVLRKDGAVLGAIHLFRREVRPFTDKEIALLENFAAQAVIAMENARLLGELRQRTEEVAELNRGLEARVAEQVEELGRVGRLKRFLAPQLAELIISQGDEKILEAHRREIVVVFCDLRGYTAFTETAEPEEVLDFLREYHGALGPLVSQFEGTLDQFSGDGIMVLFNDPIPIPDPAARAVKMAMAMRGAAGELIAGWRRHGCELGFGVGIAQGYATLGQIGFSERSGYTAIGTVCNLAARLCAEAKDGQILISSRVADAVQAVAKLEDLGNLELRGLSRPVAAFNVPLAPIEPALRVIEGGGLPSV
jgi:GAF domain-containing protein